ncbi:MAG: glycosyltransferase [bacterium]|nr:glycosyltransferase [bacterium]
MTKLQPQALFKDTQVSRHILLIGIVFAFFYLYVIAFWFQSGNLYLFTALLVGQIFSVWQVTTYIFTVWNTEKTFPKNMSSLPRVDVYITVAGEPIEIVEETVRAALAMNYPKFSVYLLNDGFVAKKENWREARNLCRALGIPCITRRIPHGAKAGNINNALTQTYGEVICVFDADHAPYKNFLLETIPFLSDPKVAFVQTPQYYKNKSKNAVTQGAWEQQELFFGPICKGKNNYNAATMCGTNMVIRRSALLEVGGMCEESVAEDFVTGLLMHSKGWKSIYLPIVLAEGLAPEDFNSYFKQQLRWARGALDIIFHYKILTRVGYVGATYSISIISITFYFGNCNNHECSFSNCFSSYRRATF